MHFRIKNNSFRLPVESVLTVSLHVDGHGEALNCVPSVFFPKIVDRKISGALSRLYDPFNFSQPDLT